MRNPVCMTLFVWPWLCGLGQRDLGLCELGLCDLGLRNQGHVKQKQTGGEGD